MQSLTKVPCFSVFLNDLNSPFCTADCPSLLHPPFAGCRKLSESQSVPAPIRAGFQQLSGCNAAGYRGPPGASPAHPTHTCTHVIACHYIYTQTYTTYTTHTTVPFNTFYYLYCLYMIYVYFDIIFDPFIAHAIRKLLGFSAAAAILRCWARRSQADPREAPRNVSASVKANSSRSKERI